MPNWCKNHLRIIGDETKEIKKLITNEKEEVVFSKLLPTPPLLMKDKSPTDCDEKEKARRMKKYGAVDWFDWRYANWGVKWEPSETAWWDGDTVTFDTPWAPPIKFLLTLSKKFKNTKFRIQFADEMWGQYPLGEVTIINGEITEEKGPKEGTAEAEKFADNVWAGYWADIE